MLTAAAHRCRRLTSLVLLLAVLLVALFTASQCLNSPAYLEDKNKYLRFTLHCGPSLHLLRHPVETVNLGVMEGYQRPRRDSWGMFMAVDFDDEDSCDSGSGSGVKMSVRDAWQQITSTLGRHHYGVIPMHKRSKVKECLIKWRNPNPSVSIKHISNAINVEFNGDALESSCYVDGFRIVQNCRGEIFAEFCLVFAYGSRSFLNWKSYTEFREYLEILSDVHKVQPVFPKTLARWNELRNEMKWGRCLSVPYLIKKSIMLSLVAQSSFLESPTPALLFEFVQHKKGGAAP